MLTLEMPPRKGKPRGKFKPGKFYERNKRLLELMEQAVALKEFKTQTEWAETIGIAYQHVSSLRRGTQSFTIDQLMRGADLHQTTMDYLLGRTDERFAAGIKEVTELDLAKELVRRLVK